MNKNTLKKLIYGFAWGIYLLSTIAGIIWFNVHNWYLNTPQKLVDPWNWIVSIGLIIGGFSLSLWGYRNEHLARRKKNSINSE